MKAEKSLETKKLWEYFRKQMARKQMKLASSEADVKYWKELSELNRTDCHKRDNQLAEKDREIASLKREITRLKEEKDYFISQNRLNSLEAIGLKKEKSQLREKIEKYQNSLEFVSEQNIVEKVLELLEDK